MAGDACYAGNAWLLHYPSLPLWTTIGSLVITFSIIINSISSMPRSISTSTPITANHHLPQILMPLLAVVV